MRNHIQKYIRLLFSSGPLYYITDFGQFYVTQIHTCLPPSAPQSAADAPHHQRWPADPSGELTMIHNRHMDMADIEQGCTLNLFLGNTVPKHTE
jgi:hypothetical protein